MEEETEGSAAALHQESEESSSLLQTAISVLRSSYLDSTSQGGFQYSQADLVENNVFLSELQAFARAKEAAGYSQEELEETFAFLLFDNEEEARATCQTGLRVNSSSISTLGDPAKGVYISKHADCLHPRPWYHGKSGYIVICKLIKGKVKVVSENHTTSYTCPSPGYDCHVAVNRTSIPAEASPCQAFRQSQYYVYEVSDGGGAAERPRQVCPYIIIACQYQEPKEMPVLARESPLELSHKASYCPWRGQLSIRGQLLCSIALRTPYSPTIPAQLPPNLDINHVMGLSDLKKKLPEAAFGKRNYTENEVCFQGVYFSLYEVEISKKDQYKMDQLVESLKEKDLAIIKYLQDQGVLILLTSSALARDDGLDPKEPVSLLALFLFTSSRSMRLTAERHHLKAERGDGDGSHISLKIASVLPGLRYALRKATGSSWEATSGASACVREHLQEYARLHPSSRAAPASPPAPAEDEWSNPFRSHSGKSFSQLQRYLSDPGSYTLEVSSALGCLAGAVPSLCEDDCEGDLSSALLSGPVPPKAGLEREANGENPAGELEQSGEEPTADISSVSRLWVQQGSRKSSRVVVTSTRKKWSPLKMQKHPVGDGGRNRKATKEKKIGVAFSFPKKPELAASPNEPLVKLANLQIPHRRKRGAEVLSAQFVPRTQPEPVVEESSASQDPGVETKRPKTLKNPDVKKDPDETSTKPVRSKMLKKVDSTKPRAGKQEEGERKEPFAVLPSEASSPHRGADAQARETCPVGAAAVARRGAGCEPHALNLLADLALGSCLPPFISRGSGVGTKEQQGQGRHRSLRVASDHEYHRVDRVKGSAAGKAWPNQVSGVNNLASVPGEKSSGSYSRRSSAHPSPAALPPGEAAEGNRHISIEHSYASQMPEHSKKRPYPRGASYPAASLARNGTRNSQAGPLVGKVLPFRHQQSSSHPRRPVEAVRRRSRPLPPRLREGSARSRAVSVCGEAVKVTCRCRGEYSFHLDSHYTNDALEKTVIRALHGPWNLDLPDDVEEMKLILHTWMALFYSKPSKLVSSSRKVVEHSNPKKYVSINSTGDLELSDDGEDCVGVETCPADSGSDPDQKPSSSLDLSTQHQGPFKLEENHADSQTDLDGAAGVHDSMVSLSSGKLPCKEEEPSSTSCPEGLSLAEHADRSLGVEDQPPAVIPEERLPDISTIPAEEHPQEALPDALSAADKPPAAPSRENPPGQAPHPTATPCSSAQSPPCGRGDQQESGWAAGSGGGPGPPEDVESMGDEAEQDSEDDDGNWATSPQPAWDSLGANPESPKADGASGEGRRPPDLFGHPGEEEEEGKREEEATECGSSTLGAVGSASSESSGADVGRHEPSGQKRADAPCPEDPDIPGELPVPSPTASAAPCPGRSSPGLSHGTESTAASTTGLSLPCGQGPSPTLSPDSSSVCPEAPGGAAGPEAALEDQEAGAGVEDPSSSDLQGCSCLSPGEPIQEGKEVLVEEQCHGPSASHRVGLEEASGADGGRGFSFDSATTAADCEAEESDGGSLGAETSPGSDETNAVMAVKAPQETQTDLHHHLQPEASSSVRERMSAGEEEHPRLQQSSLESSSQPALGGSAPASSSQQDLLPHAGGAAPLHHLEQSEEGSVLCQRRTVGPAEVAVAAERPGSPFKPRHAEEERKDKGLCPVELAGSSLVDLLVLAGRGSASPSPPRGHGAEPDSALTGHPEPLAPGSSLGSCPGAASAGGPAVGVLGKGPVLPAGSEGGSSVPRASPALLPAGPSLTPLRQPLPGGRQAEEGEGALPAVPFPPSPLHTWGGSSGGSPELSDPEDTVLRAEQLPRQDRRGSLTSEDQLEPFSGSSGQEYSGEAPQSLPAARGSCSPRSQGAAATRAACPSSTPTSSVCCSRADGGQLLRPGEASSRHIPPYVRIRDSQGVPKDYQNFVVTRTGPGRTGNPRPLEGSCHCVGQPHLSQSLLGTWRDFEEITQQTLDTERLRFHYKLKETLRAGGRPFSTSASVFPRGAGPPVMSETWPARDAATPCARRSRSPLVVTVLPSSRGLGWPRGLGDPRAPGQDSLCGERTASRPADRGRVATFHLKKLNYRNKLQDSRGDGTDVLRELNRAMRSRTDVGGEGGGMAPAHGEAASGRACAPLPGQMAAYEEMVVDLCSTLRLRLRSVAKEACGRAGMFYLVETGKDPFFGRVKALLKKTGHVEMEPLSFCEAQHLDTERLLVVIRNEDISSHIHNVPCLLKLKHCPNVLFAGVDNAEDLTGHIYQELFHSGGFVVSGDEVLEAVTLGQLKEVVKLLETLNRSGRWKWLLHYKQNKKLREDIRVDTNAHKKHSILRSCQGADLVEVLHYHSCDSVVPPSTEYIQCLLNLQVQHIGARFAVYLTEQPSVSKELLESKGILVANVSTFLRTLQEAAAQFKRSYW